VNHQGVTYLNNIFESLPGVFLSQGVPFCIHGGIKNAMIHPGAAKYNDEYAYEPGRSMSITFVFDCIFIFISSVLLSTVNICCWLCIDRC